ncbi:diacylglycerol/lipid kinase family protein [Aerococcaceae bacterium WGS1372]
MSNRVHIICHPKSGGGKGENVLHRVRVELDSFQLEHITFKTNYSTHAEILTEQLIYKWHRSAFDYLIVIGGDGTLHEVVQTLIKHQAKIPITYVPAGTGNDFSLNWQKGRNIRLIIEKMLFSSKPKHIPIIQYTDKLENRSGVIVNNFGKGVDAEANYQAQKLLKNQLINKLKVRKLSYLFGLLLSMSRIKHFKVSGQIDNHQFHYNDVSIAAILNSPTLGGGINIDRLTKAHNEEIALVLYHDITFLSMLDLLFKVLITKKTNQSKNISRYTGKTLSLQISEEIRGHVDGEVLPEKAVDLECTLSNYPFYI